MIIVATVATVVILLKKYTYLATVTIVVATVVKILGTVVSIATVAIAITVTTAVIIIPTVIFKDVWFKQKTGANLINKF